MTIKKPLLSEGDLSRLIEMAWEDRTPFEAILKNFQKFKKRAKAIS